MHIIIIYIIYNNYDDELNNLGFHVFCTRNDVIHVSYTVRAS